MCESFLNAATFKNNAWERSKTTKICLGHWCMFSVTTRSVYFPSLVWKEPSDSLWGVKRLWKGGKRGYKKDKKDSRRRRGGGLSGDVLGAAGSCGHERPRWWMLELQQYWTPFKLISVFCWIMIIAELQTTHTITNTQNRFNSDWQQWCFGVFCLRN